MEQQPRFLGKLTEITDSARQLRQSRFVRNVMTVATGTAAIQIIGAVFAPILTRQYGPAAYGAAGAFMALSAVLTNVAGLTYPIAIVLPLEDRKARQLAILSVSLSIALAVILVSILWLSRGTIAQQLGLSEVKGIELLLPLAVIFITCLSACRQWLIRTGEFTAIARVGIAHALAAHLAKAAVGTVAPSATALVTISALAPALYVLMLARNLKSLMAPRNDDAAALDVRGQLRGVEEVAREYRDFPLYRAPQHLLNSFGMTLPMLLLASTFGAPAAGYYAITQTVMGLPSMLIGKSVGDVFYPRVTESIREGRRADRQIVKATLALMAAGAIPFGVVERDRHPVWLRVGAGDVPENLRWDPRQVSDILDICGVAS